MKWKKIILHCKIVHTTNIFLYQIRIMLNLFIFTLRKSTKITMKKLFFDSMFYKEIGKIIFQLIVIEFRGSNFVIAIFTTADYEKKTICSKTTFWVFILLNILNIIVFNISFYNSNFIVIWGKQNRELTQTHKFCIL